jgi:pyruvate dehydrogenase E2 component (dihydrolipoamide acetyltransferase)
MAEKVLMLALSPTMETGTIVAWRKQEGEQVASGDVLCEVKTDKAVMDYEAVNEGALLKIVVPEGGQAKVGQPIAVVGEQGEDVAELVKEIEAEAAEAPAGGAPAEAPKAGRKAAGEKTREPAVKTAAPGAETAPGGVKASPLARRLAEQRGIELSRVSGSGPGGRVTRSDVEAAEAAPAGAGARRGPAPAPAGARGPSEGETERTEPYRPGEMPVREVPASGKRKVIARRLAESKFSAPHFYLKADIDAGSLMAARARLNEERAGEGRAKLSFNAFLIRLAAEALRRHPQVNAEWRGESIAYFGRADIGLAVAQPDGLITPVVRDCWNRGIADIDADLKLLVDRARSGKLRPGEYTGAGFTISSLGSFGIHEFTAIINPSGSTILAVGEARRLPVAGEGDEVRVKTIMTVTLSCDHRVVDGVTGALFLGDLKRTIEDPVRALL